MWNIILALQSSGAVHLGVEYLGVVRHVGRLLDGCRGPVPFELVNDGDLLLLIDRMLRQRGLDTVRALRHEEYTQTANRNCQIQGARERNVQFPRATTSSEGN